MSDYIPKYSEVKNELKDDYTRYEIKRELKKYNIRKLYHFTDKENLRSIIKNRRIYSSEYARKQGIDIVTSSDDLSKKIASDKKLENFVSLTFTKEHPMFKKKKIEGRELIWFEISTAPIFWKRTMFSPINSTDRRALLGADFKIFRLIDLGLFDENELTVKYDSKKMQAEVLIRDFLPIKFVRRWYDG